MPSVDSKKTRKRSSVIRKIKTPREHMVVLDRAIQDEAQRASRLALANMKAQSEAARREIEQREPGVKIPAAAWKLGKPEILSAAKSKALVKAEPDLSEVRAELRRDAVRLRRLLQETVRAGQTRPQTVGDPSSFFCSLTAQSISAFSVSSANFGGSASTTALTTTAAIARNRSRFVATAFAPVTRASATLLDIFQPTRFSFVLDTAGAVNITAYLTPLGTYRIFAPSAAQESLFWTAVPHPRLTLTATMRAVASIPINTGTGVATRTHTTPAVTVTLLDRALSGWTGANTEIGNLQMPAAPSTLSLPAFPLDFTSDNRVPVTVDVTYALRLFASQGGTLFVDCLSDPNAGLNAPSVVIRVDY